MTQKDSKDKRTPVFGSFYLVGAYAITLLFLGLGLADDFIGGFTKASDWIRSISVIGGALWVMLMLFFLPGAVSILLAAIWRLGRELEESAMEFLSAGGRRLGKILHRISGDP